MLVAINPYETLPIYTDQTINEYRSQKLGSLPPHIFAIGDSAFQALSNCNQDQCVVISGESGTGAKLYFLIQRQSQIYTMNALQMNYRCWENRKHEINIALFGGNK